jgi:hypothetical protein
LAGSPQEGDWISDPDSLKRFFSRLKKDSFFEYAYMSGAVMPATFGISAYVAGRLTFQILDAHCGSCTALRGSDRFAAALLILLRQACDSKSPCVAFLVGISRR